jgi:hypothetical protein
MFVLTHAQTESQTDAEATAVWREVKTVVLYRKDTPSDRYQISIRSVPYKAFKLSHHWCMGFYASQV